MKCVHDNPDSLLPLIISKPRQKEMAKKYKQFNLRLQYYVDLLQTLQNYPKDGNYTIKCKYCWRDLKDSHALSEEYKFDSLTILFNKLINYYASTLEVIEIDSTIGSAIGLAADTKVDLSVDSTTNSMIKDIINMSHDTKIAKPYLSKKTIDKLIEEEKKIKARISLRSFIDGEANELNNVM